MTVMLVTVAGAIGCVVRFLMEYAVRAFHPLRRPWATVVANVAGCFLAAVATKHVATGTSHDVLVAGFCGGLTTFSSAFAIPALLAREHHPRSAMQLVLFTPLLCLVAFALGVAI